MSLFHVYIIGLPDSETMATNSSKVTENAVLTNALPPYLPPSLRYSSLVNPIARGVPLKPFMHSFMSKEEHEEVVQLFLRAAQTSPEELDPDVQVKGGVPCCHGYRCCYGYRHRWG